MTAPGAPRPPGGYDGVYRAFDGPLERALRAAAVGKDLGQHSWTSAAELAAIVVALRLAAGDRLLDLGCGAGGPARALVRLSGCRAVGVDRSASGLATARGASAPGSGTRIAVARADASRTLPFVDRAFDAVLLLDVLVHLDRPAVFREAARLLAPGGRLFATDAGVVSGPVSALELAGRSRHEPTRFVPRGWNEAVLAAAGLRVLAAEDSTAALLAAARGRLAARVARRDEVSRRETADAMLAEERYLETVVELAERRALTRWTYVAERPPAG